MKTEVYSWRLEAEKKADLEAELRRDGQRLSELLDDLTTTWLRERRNGHSNDDAEQAAIRKRAKAAIGAVAGGDPTASQRAGELVREAIYQKHLQEMNAASRRKRAD
ncbi:MAG: hypothetical protein ABR874_23290 [Candidatus Sulfotelmatobacter sp.]|jgi:hypothetical protein